jgi:AcrR family transcriptional regulator
MSSEGLWSRTRQAAFAEIAEVAMDLFLEKGFEATTFDDIAAAVGISRRSLFRYFGTKEDIVLWGMADEGALARDALAERPDDEPLWTSLLNVLVTLLDQQPHGSRPGDNRPGGDLPGGNRPGDNRPSGNRPGGSRPGGMRPGDPERLLKISQMMYGTPSLRARSVEKHLRWQADILPEVKRRLPAATDLSAAAIIASAVACLDTAGEEWTRRQGAVPLRELLTEAFDAMGQAAATPFS